jgi:hypothetical protein
VISRTLDRIPPSIADAAMPVAEVLMVEAARHEHPNALARTAEQLLARLNPDGREPREEELERRRGFDLVKRADASSNPHGQCSRTDRGLGHDPGLTRRPRPGRRLNSGTLPAATCGRPGNFCSWLPKWRSLGADGELLKCGRTRRLATKAQRLMLFDRDGGCCVSPPAFRAVRLVGPDVPGRRPNGSRPPGSIRTHDRSATLRTISATSTSTSAARPSRHLNRRHLNRRWPRRRPGRTRTVVRCGRRVSETGRRPRARSPDRRTG